MYPDSHYCHIHLLAFDLTMLVMSTVSMLDHSSVIPLATRKHFLLAGIENSTIEQRYQKGLRRL
jgi:hypothetical protein